MRHCANSCELHHAHLLSNSQSSPQLRSHILYNDEYANILLLCKVINNLVHSPSLVQLINFDACSRSLCNTLIFRVHFFTSNLRFGESVTRICNYVNIWICISTDRVDLYSVPFYKLRRSALQSLTFNQLLYFRFFFYNVRLVSVNY